jgi:hypothetical protein
MPFARGNWAPEKVPLPPLTNHRGRGTFPQPLSSPLAGLLNDVQHSKVMMRRIITMAIIIIIIKTPAPVSDPEMH